MGDCTANAAGLIAAFAAESGFEEFFHRHYARLTGLALRVTGDRALAEEIAAEALRRVHAHWDRAPGPEQRAAWGRRATLNLALQALRARRRRLRRENAAQAEAGRSSRLPTPHDDAVAAERQAQARRVLATMPRRSARLLLLRYDGCSYREIAATLQLNPASVGTLTARALSDFEKRFHRLYGRTS